MKNLKKWGTFTVHDELTVVTGRLAFKLRSTQLFFDDERFMFTNQEPTQCLYRPLPTVDNIDPEALTGQRQNTVCARFKKLYSVFAIPNILPHLKVVAGTLAGSAVGCVTIGLAGSIFLAAMSASSTAVANAVGAFDEDQDIFDSVKLIAPLGGLAGAWVGTIGGGIAGYSKVTSKLEYKNDVTTHEKHRLLPHDTLSEDLINWKA